MKVPHRFDRDSAVFDDGNLVSSAGLVPVMTLAEQTGLRRLLGEKVRITVPRIKSGSANPAPKLATVVAGMCAGADCIDDIDVLRSGGMTSLSDGVYAPSTVGTLLRKFTFGHARQLESVLREHLVALCERADLLPGADQQVFIDIDHPLELPFARSIHRLLRRLSTHVSSLKPRITQQVYAVSASTVRSAGCGCRALPLFDDPSRRVGVSSPAAARVTRTHADRRPRPRGGRE